LRKCPEKEVDHDMSDEMPPKAPANVNLRAERDRFVAFSFAAADILLELDEVGVVSFVSGASSRLARAAPSLGTTTVLNFPFLSHVATSDHFFVSELLNNIAVGGKMTPVTVRFNGRDDEAIPAVLGGCRLPNNPNGLYLTITFISPGLGNPRDGEQSSLPGRQDFETVVERKLHQSMSIGQPVSLTYLLLDGMTAYQRQGGNSADKLLSMLSSYLRANSLGGDGVGAMSDDRYAVIHGREVKTDTLRRRVSEIAQDEAGDAIAVSAESVVLDDGVVSESDAVRALLYSLRQFESQDGAGLRLQTVIDAARQTLKKTVPRIAEARSVIDARGFELAFQPIVDLSSGQIKHFEALSRVKGFPSVQEFILFIEDTGMIEEFDMAVLENVLRVLALHARDDWRPHVAVNVSARSLGSDSFLPTLNKVLRPYKDLVPQILFELTETTFIRDFAAANQRLQQLRSFGNKVCMDDVGAGGTSFESLRSIQVDYAKIDGSLVKGSHSSVRTRRLLESVMQYCAHADIAVIAEFIETEDDEDLVRSFGVGYGQGNRYGKPRLDFREAYGADSR
jgi:EAL domain-containing protein (putative c-di-GMP-specific phosphodiesterase class I)/GGDEF domain-containing protein